MLDSLYGTLFFPDKPHSLPSLVQGALILLVVALLWAFLAASGNGPVVYVVFSLLFWALLIAEAIWAAALLGLVTSLMGGQASQPAILTVVAEAAWPLLLLGPSAAVGVLIPWLGGLLIFLVWLYGTVCLAGGIKRLEGWSWNRAFWAVGVAFALTVGSLLALLGIPLMVALLF